jgi:dolichol kinase
MDAAYQDCRDLVLDLHRVLSEVDRVSRRKPADPSFRERFEAVRTRLKALAARELAQGRSKLRDQLQALARELESHPRPGADWRAAWLAFRAKVVPPYEQLVLTLRAEAIHVPSLRPTNHARKALHVASALAGLLVLELLPTPGAVLAAATALLALTWSLEIGRRHSVRVRDFCLAAFGRTMHPHEVSRVNSATWYVTALFLLALTGQTIPSAAAVATLGLGDPAGGTIGRKWGRLRIGEGRTLEGSLAFVLFGFGASLAVLRLAHGGLAWPVVLAVSASAAVAGALAELVSRRIDDNFSIPLCAWLAARGALWAFGL